MRLARKKEQKPKYEVLDRLLWNFGQGTISDDQFWSAMERNGLAQHDIDLFMSGELEK